jgi:hypothetical protein
VGGLIVIEEVYLVAELAAMKASALQPWISIVINGYTKNEYAAGYTLKSIADVST